MCCWLHYSLTMELIQFWTLPFFTWTTSFSVYHTLLKLGNQPVYFHVKCQFIANRLKLTKPVLFCIFTNLLLSFLCSVLPADGHPERPRTLDISPRPRPHPSHYLSPQAGSTGMPDLVSPPSKLQAYHFVQVNTWLRYAGILLLPFLDCCETFLKHICLNKAK